MQEVFLGFVSFSVQMAMNQNSYIGPIIHYNTILGWDEHP